MRDRLPLIFSITALVMVVLGATPIGEAAWNQVLPRNSVGTLQLQRNAVTSSKLAPNTVRAGQVVNGSLLVEDFKPGQIPQGPKGDKGDRGPAGPVGISGYEIVTVAQTSGAATTAFFGGQAATCPSGKKVLGGGASVVSTGGSVTGGYNVLQDGPSGDNGWLAVFSISNPPGFGAFVRTVYAICAKVS